MIVVRPDQEGIRIAAEAIRLHEVVAYPTETVYGLGADPFSEEAVRQLFEVKGRDEGNPVLLVVADLDQLELLTAGVSARASAYMRAFWPGPLSMLVSRSERLPRVVTAGRDKVCVRCPACPVARALCMEVGSAITSSSANRSGEAPAMSLAQIDLAGVAVGIDGGVLEPSEPSTVLDPDSGQVLREGAVRSAELDLFVRRWAHLF